MPAEGVIDIAMKKEEKSPHSFSSISEAHAAFGLPKPLHPLVSLIDNTVHPVSICQPDQAHVLSFYKISYKPKQGKLRYGQTYYDFDEGGMLFASPNQVIGGNSDQDIQDCSQYTLLIHPDFLWNYPLAKKIKQYGFFSYSTHEALYLSEQEKNTIFALFKSIGEELSGRIDDFSQDVLVSQLELLLNYANRFYKRQFITRKPVNSDVLQKLEALLNDYFDQEHGLNKGIPTVQFLSDQLHLSPSYLSDLLRSLTGQNAQQHIHSKLIEKAKEKLSITQLSVAEIAYELGFEHPQSFHKLFKTKTKLSPLEFRRSFA